MFRHVHASLLVFAALAGGCATSPFTGSQLDRGYTLVLPGCLGQGPWDRAVAHRLQSVPRPTAVDIHDWTRGPHMLLVNVFDGQRREREIDAISKKIVNYQASYPGRPVYLVGHSGGASMVVKTLEALPAGTKVTGAVLLSPGLSTHYDLRLAQRRTERGIHNFYSPADVFIAGAFTSVVGTADGGHLGSAGMLGFEPPETLTADELAEYQQGLTQHCYTPGMIAEGHPGGHFGWTLPAFVDKHVIPIVYSPDDRATATPSETAPKP